MKKIKLPGSITLLFSGMAAFWISGIVNPGFTPIGVMILLLIPTLLIDFMYPQSEMDTLLGKLNSYDYGNNNDNPTVESEIVDEKTAIEKA